MTENSETICIDGICETYTGNMVDLANPDPDTICIEDIAHALSAQVRFNGHCEPAYTVADHSLACWRHACEYSHSPEDQLGALLHDAPEAYIGDIISPLKRLLAPLIKPIEARLESVIWAALCGDIQKPDHAFVKLIDTRMLLAEAFHLMPSKTILGLDSLLDLTIDIKPLEPVIAELEFMVAYHTTMRKITHG